MKLVKGSPNRAYNFTIHYFSKCFEKEKLDLHIKSLGVALISPAWAF